MHIQAFTEGGLVRRRVEIETADCTWRAGAIVMRHVSFCRLMPSRPPVMHCMICCGEL